MRLAEISVSSESISAPYRGLEPHAFILIVATLFC